MMGIIYCFQFLSSHKYDNIISENNYSKYRYHLLTQNAKYIRGPSRALFYNLVSF